MSPMSKVVASVAGLAVAAVIASPAGAQSVITQKNISLALAQAIANAAIAQCRTLGYKTSVTVVDREGLPMVMLHDDGAGLSTREGSDRKAYTAAAFRQPSAAFVKRMQDRPGSAGSHSIYARSGARRRAADQGRRRRDRRGRRFRHARQGRRVLAGRHRQSGGSIEVGLCALCLRRRQPVHAIPHLRHTAQVCVQRG